MMWFARQLRTPGCGDHFLPSLRRLLHVSHPLFFPSAGPGDARGAPAQQAHFMVDFLVGSCGLSIAEALWASKSFSHLKSSARPDANLRLLRREGLGDADIKHAVLRFPRVLLVDAKRTLEPKMRALREAGFSRSEVAQLISIAPQALFARDLPHRVEFWRKLFGTNNNVLRAVKKERGLLCFSVGVIIPRLSLLCSLGVPESRIRTLLLQRPRLVYVKTDKIKASAEQVKRLGFSPGSPMFMLALAFVSIFSRSAVDAKLKLLRSFGWTEAELISALHKSPNILSYSKKKIHAAMQFFLNEAGCEPSYIASNPTLIGLSLEKRLMPRWYVMQCLGMKGLPRQRRSLFTVMLMTEHNFMQKCIAPYRDELPELGEAYTALHAKIATTYVVGGERRLRRPRGRLKPQTPRRWPRAFEAFKAIIT